MEQVPQAAAAQPDEQHPAAPETALEAAVVSGDFGAYRKAARAEASGEPLPVPAADAAARKTPASAAAAPADRQVSKRQHEANEKIREAVEKATADLRAENARLKGQAPAAPRHAAPPDASPAAGARPETPRADPEPNPGDLQKYPAGEYDPKFLKDAAGWAAREELRSRDREAQSRADGDRALAVAHERATKFSTALKAARDADATFLERLSPEVASLRPYDALQPGEKAGPLNVLAELVIDSDIAPQIMLHLSEHPEALEPFKTARDPRSLERAFVRLEQSLERPAAAAAPPAFTPQPKTVSAAPPPPAMVDGRPTESGDPIEGAVKSRDFGAYREAQRRLRLARRA